VNGHLQAALNHSRLIIVEEWAALPVVSGSAVIPPGRTSHVVAHVPQAYVPLSRAPDALDRALAEQASRLIGDGVALQLGVGGPIEALGEALRERRGLRIITGAISASIRRLHDAGCLSPGSEILSGSLVGDDDLTAWAAGSAPARLLSSKVIHDPVWLAAQDRLWSINVALSVDVTGNVNSELIGTRRISGRGGAPNFAAGAHRSPGGGSVVLVRSDRPGTLVEHIAQPTILSRYVDYVVSDRGIAALRDADAPTRRRRLESILG